MSDTMMALLSALILAIALTANFFVAAWRLNLVGILERRSKLCWRRVAAGTGAASLPWLGAYLALTLAPTLANKYSAADLAFSCAALGYGLHCAMDALVQWGNGGVTAS